MTPNEQRILELLEGGAPQPASDLVKKMKCAESTIYRCLDRLVARSLVEVQWWSPEDATDNARPRRLFYRKG